VELKTQGSGVSVRLRMEINTLNESHENASGQVIHNKEIFRVLESCCRIDRWGVEFRDSKHDTIYEMLSSLFSARIKKHVEELVVGKMKAFADVFNHRIWILYNEARLKQEELGYLVESKKNEALENWSETKESLKESLLHSAPAESLREAAKDAGKEALKIGFEKVKEAPSLGAAVSEGLSDLGSKAKEIFEGSDLVGDLKEKAGLSSEYEDKSHYTRVPLSFRDYAPVPAASFVSSDLSETSTLGNIPNSAKYPASVVGPQKKEERSSSKTEQASFQPSQ